MDTFYQVYISLHFFVVWEANAVFCKKGEKLETIVGIRSYSRNSFFSGKRKIST